MRRRAFTLVELLIVVTLIGILIAFILRASMGGIRRAEEKATVGLIAKLEAGMTDRIDALASQHPAPTAAHYALAQLYNSAVVFHQPASQRAQVIASYDYLRAELPDSFVVQGLIPLAGNPSPGTYPLNFAAERFGTSGTAADYVLPLGANGAYVPVAGTAAGNMIGVTVQNANPAPTGMCGASFASAAAIYHQLGYSAQGTDGADNNGDGFIDDLLEGVSGLPAGEQQAMAVRLSRHTHKTCRAEMLYAIMIEGTGPLGSVFQREDFGPNDVADTDGDGLMEFVDAWGEPLQFFRWPIMHHSDVQRGFPDLAKISQDLANKFSPGPYASVYENRDVDTLDANQQLLAPAWWTAYNDGPLGWPEPKQGTIGAAAMDFQRYFHTLADPLAIQSGNPSNATYWDRSIDKSKGLFARRAYYTRFLILSGGPDKIPGVARLFTNYPEIDDRGQFPLADGSYASARDGTGAPYPFAIQPAPPTEAQQIASQAAGAITALIQVENQGGRIDPRRLPPFYYPNLPAGRNDTNTFLEYAAQDDVTSHNLNSLGGPLQ